MLKEPIVLDRILSLPEADVKALHEGTTIAALPIFQVQKGWDFLLYAHPEFNSSQDQTVEIWATCESFQIIHDRDKIKILSELTPWSESQLNQLFEERGHLSLALLKVSKLPTKLVLSQAAVAKIKVGRFTGILQIEESLKSPIHVSDLQPILDDRLFAHRKQQLENLTPPEHPELEELQSTIDRYSKDHPEVQGFSDDLQQFLGWAEPKTIDNIPDWVPQITTSGNSSDGYLFEKLVRQAFIQLGFTNTLNNALDPEAMGGAGGIDIYCEKPFAIVGECKASKNESVPSSVSAQLIHLGTTHLGKEKFNSSIKIIFAAGKLTNHAEKAAVENQMNIMRPETLQRLVELKIAHPGSIDLLELKPCLEAAPFGTDADLKLNKLIDEIHKRLKVRSHVIQSVKSLKEDGDSLVSASTVRTHFNTAFAPILKERLDTPEQAYSILIELSSPLTGYLGRIKCDTWRGDRFYFLRDLTV
jgi:hypothetical protein